MGRLPRLPLTNFESTGVTGHQSVTRDHLASCDSATDGQHRAHDIVCKYNALAVLVWNANTQPSPMRCAWFPNLPLESFGKIK